MMKFNTKLVRSAQYLLLLSSLVMFVMANLNAKAHSDFREFLSKRSESVVPRIAYTYDSMVVGNYSFTGIFAAESGVHNSSFILSLRSNGTLFSQGFIGPYYFENFGKWYFDDSGSISKIYLHPISGSGMQLPFYGLGKHLKDGDSSIEIGGFNLIQTVGQKRLVPNDYHYSVWRDPRLIISLLCLIAFGALQLRHKEQSKKH
ncbi:hypothetical protein [Vibrio genomosp. F10]|uniref:hypothetical protein n=1 Tax=Vibrio genomosp. F10 TaxID=723171 RepID=UPI00114CF470|nr:hypothetical protein [Vibrio genomosp. F10]